MLRKKWDDIKNRVKTLEESTRAKENSDYFSRLSSELNSVNEDLESIITDYNFFKSSGLIDKVISSNWEYKDLENEISNLYQKFKKNGDRDTLTRDQVYEKVKKRAIEVCTIFETHLNSSWHKFRKQCYPSGESSEVLKSKVELQDPKNRELADSFEEIEKDWFDLIAVRTTNIEKIEAIKEKGAKLQSIVESLKERQKTLPENVKKFLDSFSISGQAKLDLFNEEVRSWLKANNIDDKYRIRRLDE